ncbi:MAG: zinc ribbon domain-containing protein [Thermoplasmatota archaeon]
MAEGELISFTDNYKDKSKEAGFQFVFYCDICKEGYKTRFIESKTHKKGKLIGAIGNIASAAGQVTGNYSAGYGASRASRAASDQFSGMNAKWHKEHEAAFEKAQNETKGHFERCPRCTKWVCENCWNEQEGLCTDCAPRVSSEVAAAKAEKAVKDIKKKASQKQVFDGEIESKQTICPKCGKPAGEGKFCNNCGNPLNLNKCPKCGAKNSAGTNFCGECGTKLE